MNYSKKIVLDDGQEYYGYGFGADVERICEIVFNTSMVGYQEIVSDPSYTCQTVVMTYPLIGNYGVADDDYESKTPSIGAIVVRDYNDMPSNFRYTKTLAEVLEENDIPGITGVDTRKLARTIRDKGSRMAILTNADTPTEEAVKRLNETVVPTDLVSQVSCKKRWYSRTSNHKFNVVALDCGIKLSIIRELNSRGCNVTVVPYDTTAEEIEFMKPDGVFVSNGPGNPEDASVVIETVKQLKGKYPLFGIGLGHQIISLAYGATTYKLKFGHHGANHPVKNFKEGRIEIANQNHSYAVDEASLEKTVLKVTHKNVLDGTVEGVECAKDKTIASQYYPANIPGPEKSKNLYDDFVELMKGAKENA